MKRKVKIVRRDYAAEYAKDVHDYEQLRSWFELMIERAHKRADAQEVYRNELLERVAYLRAMVTNKNNTISLLQEKVHTILPTVNELRKTISNLENMVQARNERIAELQKTVDKLYTDLFKKEES